MKSLPRLLFPVCALLLPLLHCQAGTVSGNPGGGPLQTAPATQPGFYLLDGAAANVPPAVRGSVVTPGIIVIPAESQPLAGTSAAYDFGSRHVSAGASLPLVIAVRNRSNLPMWIEAESTGAETNPDFIQLGAFPLRAFGPGETAFVYAFFTPQSAGPHEGRFTFRYAARKDDLPESTLLTLRGAGTNSALYISPTGNDANDGLRPASAKKTIQATLNGLPDNETETTTLLIEPGQYAERIKITHNVALLARAPGVQIMLPALPEGTPVTSKNLITVAGLIRAELRGLTLMGPGADGCGSFYSALRIGGEATVVVRDSQFKEVRDNPIGGCQSGVAIIAGRPTPSTLIAEGNSFEGYQKGAIVVEGEESRALIYGNQFKGVGGDALIAKNGVQISRGAVATVRSNLFTGHRYTPAVQPAPWSSCGLLLRSAAPASVITGNQFTDNQTALCIEGETPLTELALTTTWQNSFTTNETNINIEPPQ